MTKKVKTPCIGVCSTGLGDSVCRGCKRFAHEVIHWNSYSETQRMAIMMRIEALATQVVRERIIIVDERQLAMQLEQHKVRVHPALNAHCKALEAIRVFGSQLKELSWIGCQATPHWQHVTVADLKRSIDEDLFELSRAHHERYFPGHI